jgi:RNA polymerase sigma-70 factor (ECF subfamily)
VQTPHPQLSELYRLHAASVFRRARRLLGNEAEAHEIVQDLFVSLLERPEQFAGRSTMSTFLYGATTHLCLNRLRNQRNRARLIRGHTEADQAPPRTSVDNLLALRAALASLPAELAEVAIYYFVDELSHQEIADLLGCSRRHVGNLVGRVQQWGQAQEEVPCSAN